MPRIPSVSHAPSVLMPPAFAGTSASSSALPMSVPPSSAHQTMSYDAPSAIVQKCFTPSMTQPSSVSRIAVSISSVRDRLTAGSLPHEPKSLPCATTSGK